MTKNKLYLGSLSLHLEVEANCHNLTIDLQEKFRNMLEKEIFTDFIIKVLENLYL